MLLARVLVDAAHGQALAQGAAAARADHAHAGVEWPVDDGGPLLGVEVGFPCHSRPPPSWCSIDGIVHQPRGHAASAGTMISPKASVLRIVCCRAVTAAAIASRWSWLVRWGMPSRPSDSKAARLQRARVVAPLAPCHRVHEAVGNTSITSTPSASSAPNRARPS